MIDLPKTDLTILPAFPDGENDWYVTEPEITFTVYSEEPETITTWFSLNGEEWIQYKEPLKLSSGEFEIRYYSKQGDAKESIQSYSVAVDTLPPYLQLPEDGIDTNKKAYTLEIPVIDSHFCKRFYWGNRDYFFGRRETANHCFTGRRRECVFSSCI